jgi:excisionase family DNA binding protein
MHMPCLITPAYHERMDRGVIDPEASPYPEPGTHARVHRRLYTPTELATVLGVTTETVRAWARTGKLTATWTGPAQRWIRFRREDVEAAAKAGKIKALTAGWLKRI